VYVSVVVVVDVPVSVVVRDIVSLVYDFLLSTIIIGTTLLTQ